MVHIDIAQRDGTFLQRDAKMFSSPSFHILVSHFGQLLQMCFHMCQSGTEPKFEFNFETTVELNLTCTARKMF